jgi:hypothetical protein
MRSFLNEIYDIDYRDPPLGKLIYQAGKIFKSLSPDLNTDLCFLIANKLGYY